MLDALRASHHHDVRVRETRSLADLVEVCREISERDARGVVLAGGDGTLMASLSELSRAHGGRPLPDVAIVPGGTVCTIGGNFGVSGDRVAYTRRLLRAITSGTAKRVVLRPLTVVEHVSRAGAEASTTRVGFIFGFGLVSSFFEAYYQGRPREALGLKAAAAIVAEVFGGSFVGGRLAKQVLTPQPAELFVDGEKSPHEGFSLFVASVVRDLGLHMRLTYRAGERHDRFHAVGSALGPAALGPQMPLVLAGKALRGAGVDALSSSIQVRFPKERRSYVLDGELFEADRIDVSLADALTLRTL